jgi:hypothetical protein
MQFTIGLPRLNNEEKREILFPLPFLSVNGRGDIKFYLLSRLNSTIELTPWFPYTTPLLFHKSGDPGAREGNTHICMRENGL